MSPAAEERSEAGFEIERQGDVDRLVGGEDPSVQNFARLGTCSDLTTDALTGMA